MYNLLSSVTLNWEQNKTSTKMVVERQAVPETKLAVNENFLNNEPLKYKEASRLFTGLLDKNYRFNNIPEKVSAHRKWLKGVNIERVKKPEELYMILDVLVLGKRALSKKVGDVTMYRFTLNPDQRKKVLTHYIKELETQLDGLKKELASI